MCELRGDRRRHPLGASPSVIFCGANGTDVTKQGAMVSQVLDPSHCVEETTKQWNIVN
jgi:hypothetical protein